MTTKTQKPISITARCEFKNSDYVLWGVQSGEKRYEVTCVNHTVTSCQERNGEACKGWMFSGHCKHGDLVQVLEWEHAAKTDAPAPIVEVQQRPIDERGVLNGQRAFSLMR